MYGVTRNLLYPILVSPRVQKSSINSFEGVSSLNPLGWSNHRNHFLCHLHWFFFHTEKVIPRSFIRLINLLR